MPIARPPRVRGSAARIRLLAALLVLTTACERADPRFTGYARRLQLTGDSAFAATAPYRGVRDASALSYQDSISRQLERQATAFALLVPPDTIVPVHRQMTEGLDTLVVALRTLRERETSCVDATRLDCRGDLDLRAILASLRRGESIYLGARRRMQRALDAWQVDLPDPG